MTLQNEINRKHKQVYENDRNLMSIRANSNNKKFQLHTSQTSLELICDKYINKIDEYKGLGEALSQKASRVHTEVAVKSLCSK